jgi:aspartate kinase
MIVMKFGGTSTRDAGAVGNVARIVALHADRQPIVVISAISQASNILEHVASLASTGNAGAAVKLAGTLLERHTAMADGLIRDQQGRTDYHAAIADARRSLGELIDGVSIMLELTPHTLDAFYAHGELLASKLVCAALLSSGLSPEWIDTRDFLVTDDRFTRASPVMEEVRTRAPLTIGAAISRGSIPVTQGFIGATADGRRTTMGRESSDFSATLIGGVMAASEVQIWTDVDGVLTADPAVVALPRRISRLSFDEAYELSYFGAKVLHPKTILPAIESEIPVRILNSRRPASAGTLIVNGTSASGGTPLVKSVTFTPAVDLITISHPDRSDQVVQRSGVDDVFAAMGARIVLSMASASSSSFVVEPVKNGAPLRQALTRFGAVGWIEGKGVVTLVGRELRSVPRLTERTFGAIGECGVGLISFGASDSSISLVLDAGKVHDAVRRLHREFFETDQPDPLFEPVLPE